MNEQNRSMKLLNKVYDHLDSIDVSKLSIRDLQDFLEVVQNGRFLESIGQMPQYGLGVGGFGGALTKPPVGADSGNEKPGSDTNE